MFLVPDCGRCNLHFPGPGYSLLTEGIQTFKSCFAVFMTWSKFCHYLSIVLEKLVVASLVLIFSIFMELDGFYDSKADQGTQDNRVHTFISCLHKIHFNIILDSKLMSSTPSFPYMFHDKIYCAFLLFYGQVTRRAVSQLLYRTCRCVVQLKGNNKFTYFQSNKTIFYYSTYWRQVSVTRRSSGHLYVKFKSGYMQCTLNSMPYGIP